jgi:hypothetical protein
MSAGIWTPSCGFCIGLRRGETLCESELAENLDSIVILVRIACTSASRLIYHAHISEAIAQSGEWVVCGRNTDTRTAVLHTTGNWLSAYLFPLIDLALNMLIRQRHDLARRQAQPLLQRS